ncbi:MAG TPA: hypothetical protein VER03_21295, partial [Bryobacteraceae bacterium]|nr:hypothetical protein [Bryobacteraceae bacterium]
MLLTLLSVAAVWAIGSLVLMGVFAATSYDDFADLVGAAARAAIPAVWLVPAWLFLQGSSVAEAFFGLALTAVAIRLLVGARPPRHLQVKTARRKGETPVLDVFFTRTLPLIGASLLLQAGFVAAVVSRPLLAALLVAAAVAPIAWWWGPRAPGSRRAAASMLIGAVTLTVLQFRIVHTPRVTMAAPPKKPSFMPLTGGVDANNLKPLPGTSLVPGVILRPDTTPAKIEAFDLLPASRRGILASRPMVIQFTGEYHVFPASSGHVQADSAVLKGTPLDAAYVSMAGGSIETEAYQALNPPLDLTHCGRIQVSLSTGERSPSSATLILVTPSGSYELGTEIFGLESSGPESLEFAVPALPADLKVKALRIVFRRDPYHRSQSTKAAVDKFTFL